MKLTKTAISQLKKYRGKFESLLVQYKGQLAHEAPRKFMLDEISNKVREFSNEKERSEFLGMYNNPDNRLLPPFIKLSENGNVIINKAHIENLSTNQIQAVIDLIDILLKNSNDLIKVFFDITYVPPSISLNKSGQDCQAKMSFIDGGQNTWIPHITNNGSLAFAKQYEQFIRDFSKDLWEGENQKINYSRFESAVLKLVEQFTNFGKAGIPAMLERLADSIKAEIDAYEAIRISQNTINEILTTLTTENFEENWHQLAKEVIVSNDPCYYLSVHDSFNEFTATAFEAPRPETIRLEPSFLYARFTQLLAQELQFAKQNPLPASRFTTQSFSHIFNAEKNDINIGAINSAIDRFSEFVGKYRNKQHVWKSEILQGVARKVAELRKQFIPSVTLTQVYGDKFTELVRAFYTQPQNINDIETRFKQYTDLLTTLKVNLPESVNKVLAALKKAIYEAKQTDQPTFSTVTSKFDGLLKKLEGISLSQQLLSFYQFLQEQVNDFNQQVSNNQTTVGKTGEALNKLKAEVAQVISKITIKAEPIVFIKMVTHEYKDLLAKIKLQNKPSTIDAETNGIVDQKAIQEKLSMLPEIVSEQGNVVNDAVITNTEKLKARIAHITEWNNNCAASCMAAFLVKNYRDEKLTAGQIEKLGEILAKYYIEDAAIDLQSKAVIANTLNDFFNIYDSFEAWQIIVGPALRHFIIKTGMITDKNGMLSNEAFEKVANHFGFHVKFYVSDSNQIIHPSEAIPEINFAENLDLTLDVYYHTHDVSGNSHFDWIMPTQDDAEIVRIFASERTHDLPIENEVKLKQVIKDTLLILANSEQQDSPIVSHNSTASILRVLETMEKSAEQLAQANSDIPEQVTDTLLNEVLIQNLQPDNVVISDSATNSEIHQPDILKKSKESTEQISTQVQAQFTNSINNAYWENVNTSWSEISHRTLEPPSAKTKALNKIIQTTVANMEISEHEKAKRIFNATSVWLNKEQERLLINSSRTGDVLRLRQAMEAKYFLTSENINQQDLLIKLFKSLHEFISQNYSRDKLPKGVSKIAVLLPSLEQLNNAPLTNQELIEKFLQIRNIASKRLDADGLTFFSSLTRSKITKAFYRYIERTSLMLDDTVLQDRQNFKKYSLQDLTESLKKHISLDNSSVPKTYSIKTGH